MYITSGIYYLSNRIWNGAFFSYCGNSTIFDYHQLPTFGYVHMLRMMQQQMMMQRLNLHLAWLAKGKTCQIPGNKKDSRFHDMLFFLKYDNIQHHVLLSMNFCLKYVFCLEWRVWSCQNDMSPDAEGLWTSFQLLPFMCYVCVFCVVCKISAILSRTKNA